MSIKSKNEIIELLKMPYEEFESSIKKQAKDVHIRFNDNKINVTAMLGYDNICKNQCTYCGMRAGNSSLKRYRMNLSNIKLIEDSVKKADVHKIFFISGEDPKYKFNDMIDMVSYGKSLGLTVSLASGEMSFNNYKTLKDAGLDEYVLKFETSNQKLFEHIKPSTTYEKRMKSIENIKKAELKLGSGNIIDFPNQTIEDIACDILLMNQLEISWAPVIPYMPVIGTPMAEEGKRGSTEIALREISILRLMMPKVDITAEQPGKDLKNGLSDVQGNLDALDSGANVLFVEMLPPELAKNFNVIDNRMIKGIENIKNLAKLSGMRY